MTMSIKRIVLYAHNGEQRELTFKPGCLNVITGDSKTGKSAIIDIIDYCLGRGSCNVAEGVIRRSVAWFGLEVLNGDDILFIARKNPGPGTDAGSEIHLRRGVFSQAPAFTDLSRNIADNEFTTLLTRFLGISENEHRPTSGSRLPLEATLRHALFFCFQKQDEIDNRERLFHRQGDQFIPQAIKDTLPYFLGAVDEDHFLKQNELDISKDALRELEQRQARQSEQRDLDLGKVRRIVSDGKRVGLIPDDFEPVDQQETIRTLSDVARTDLTNPNSMPDFGSTIARLRNESSQLRETLQRVSDESRAARLLLSEQSAFSRETTEQKARLSSIGLFKEDAPGMACPLCESTLETPTPKSRQLNAALARVTSQLQAVEVEQPHLQRHIEALEERRVSLERDLTDRQSMLARAVGEDEKAKAYQDALVDRARVVGRIGAFMDSVRPSSEEVDLSPLIANARRKVETLEAALNADDASQRLETYLNLIGKQMSRYAERLDLEHSGSALRLDIKKLTVVADTEDGPIPLHRMGSGENWVGYHVLTHLALHWWFRKRERPVPGILIFDQPSQAHYPAERDQEGRLDPLDDKDRHAVQALFELMNSACQEIEGLQLLVLDHAHLTEDWFEAAIVEEWRRGKFLVPPEWDRRGPE